MEGQNRSIAEIFYSQNLYRIPGYQRNYQWAEGLWQALVADILIASTNPDNSAPHWLGILLTSKSPKTIHPGTKGKQEFIVIDGQQRLTTIALWLAALIHHAKDNGVDIDYSVEELASISVQESDKKAFAIALGDKWRLTENWALRDHQILRAYRYFRYLLWLGQAAVAEEDPVKFPEPKVSNAEASFEKQWEIIVSSKKGVDIPRGAAVDSKLLLSGTLDNIAIFSLVHDPKLDETQAAIFETLNGRRQELEPLDHVRNSLFVRINEIESTDLYNKYWYPAETALRKVSLKKMKPGKAFIYDYVISRGEKSRQKSINATRGYSHFATMIKDLKDSDIKNFVTNDLVPAMLTWQVVVRTENKVTYDEIEHKFPEGALRLMSNIRDLSSGPANPVVLHYATGYVRGVVSEADLVSALSVLENFLVRQILAGRPMSPLRARLMDLMGNIDGAYDVEVLKSALRNSDWVSDAELRRAVTTEPLYQSATPGALGAIFRGIERSLSGNGAMRFSIGKSAESYTIEHIFPQKTSEWLPDIKLWGDPLENYQLRLHALGNLTVATREHNSAVGNQPFAKKQSYPTGSGNAAPLSLNKTWLDSSVTDWTPARMDQRSYDLLSAALQYWKSI
jgi:hypothetical protein